MKMATINALNIIPHKTDSCPTMGDYAIAQKRNVKWGNHKKGDIVLFDFNHNGTSDHIGIVISLNKDGSITTVEGNTGSGSNTNGGQVQKRTRYRSQVNYFVRPRYTADITADMVIATALAEVGTKESPKNSNKVEYNRWFYGKNLSAFWCCTFVCWVFAHVKPSDTVEIKKEVKKVEEDIKAITKPTGKYQGTLPSPTLKKGMHGSNVGALQKFLNWYGKFNLEVDNDFGKLTEKAVKVFQKTEGLVVDGICGAKTIAAIKKYKAQTKVEKVLALIDKYSYSVGTSESVFSYKKKSGRAKDAYKKALKKYMGKTKRKDQTDCGYFINTIMREVGVDKDFLILPSSAKKPFPKNSGVDLVHNGGKVKDNELKPGDIVAYRKKKKTQHTYFYRGDGIIAEAGRGIRFPRKRKDEFKCNNSNVKHNTIRVYRIKE